MKKILIPLGLIVLTIVLAGIYKFNSLSGQPGYDIDRNKVTNEEHFTFICRDEAFGTFSINFEDENMEKIAYLSLSDLVIKMKHVPSGSGEKYENTSESFVFWEKGGIAFIEKEGSIIHSDCELSSRIQGNFVTIIVPDLDIPVTIDNPDIITPFDGGSVLLKTEFMTVISKVSTDADYYAIPFVVSLSGSGSSYYIGLFYKTPQGFEHYDSYFLGDRIKIQSVQDEIQMVSVEFISDKILVKERFFVSDMVPFLKKESEL